MLLIKQVTIVHDHVVVATAHQKNDDADDPKDS